MKTEPLDFALSVLALAAVGALALAITAFGFAPTSRLLLGEYHVLADFLVLLLVFGAIAGATVRMLLAFWPLVPGEHAMETGLFTRWKLIAVLTELGRGALLPFTTEFSKAPVARLFGARIGRNTALAGRMTDFPFVTVGDGGILGLNSVVTGHAITSGKILLREVRIGPGATVGVGAVIMPGVELGPGSVVAAGSVVTIGTRIPAGELWGGIPARKIKAIAPDDVRG